MKVPSSCETYLTHFNKERGRKRPTAGSFGIKFSDVSRMSWTVRRRHVTWNFVPRERELFDSYRFSDASASEAVDPATNRMPARTHARKCPSCVHARTDTTDTARWTGRCCSWACRLKSWLKHRVRASQRWTRDPSGEGQHVAGQRNNCHLR